jgi:hypothetical protein
MVSQPHLVLAIDANGSISDDRQRTLLQLSIPEQPYLTLYSVSSPLGELDEDLFVYCKYIFVRDKT